MTRKSGLILHPTSLWGPEGIGTLGLEAYRFVEQLAEAGQQVWQILPLGPPGPFDSPYMATSAFAGNVQLIDLRTLAADGWLPTDAIDGLAAFGNDRVDFGRVVPRRRALLEQAARRRLRAGFDVDAFAAEHPWAPDYALFTVLSRQHGEPWSSWPDPLRHRDPGALSDAREALSEPIAVELVLQGWFLEQWGRLRNFAHQRGVSILGDMPIFVALHSADVWARPELFFLDDSGEPTVVAGVPPDYFSATGQRWGNPLYDWKTHAAEGYAWWIERLRVASSLVDEVRIDHFRGFEAYWEIPAEAETAVDGRWVEGPGRALFDAMRAALGAVPVVAEDLGIITPGVEALRDDLDIPGMTVLQFAFGGDADNNYLPHNHRPRQLAYTGTHDNDTTVGWYASLDDRTAHHVRVYLGVSGDDIAWDLIRAAWSSVAELAVAPVQDVLSEGTERRMNVPGAMANNWSYRMVGPLPDDRIGRLRQLTGLYGRAR